MDRSCQDSLAQFFIEELFMACKHCEEARQALIEARIFEALQHTAKAVKTKLTAKTKTGEPKKAAKKDPGSAGNRPTGQDNQE